MRIADNPPQSIIWEKAVFVRFDNNGRPYLCDVMGFIYTLEQIQELIKSIQPFYTRVSDVEIQYFNQRLKDYYEGRIELNPQNRFGDIFRELERISLIQSNSEKLSQTSIGYIYLIQDGEHIKIGKSRDWRARFQALQTATPHKLKPIMVIETQNPNGLEKQLHNKYKDCRVRGEWFKLSRDQIRELKRELEAHYKIIENPEEVKDV